MPKFSQCAAGAVPGESDYVSLRKRLDECHEWPCSYMFKFIVPQAEELRLAAILDQAKIIRRPSRNGKYVSLTAECSVSGSEEVVMIYQKVAHVPGIIAL